MDLEVVHKPTKKSKRGDVKKQCPVISFEEFPRDIAIDIISRLPATSLVKFRTMSQFCSQLSRDPDLTSPFFNRSLENNSILVFLNSPSTRTLYFVELSGDRKEEIVKRIQTPFSGTDIVASCNGILCLSDGLSKLYIYNPLTNRHKELITSYCGKKEMFLGFGYNTLTKEYVVIKGGEPRQPFRKKLYLRICSLTHHSRIRMIEAPHPFEDISVLGSQAFLNGRFHWCTVMFFSRETGPPRLVPARRILSFDPSDEQFRVISIPIRNYLILENCHVADLGGLLSAVFWQSYSGRFDIWIMKEYGVTESWRMIARVDTRSIFLEKRVEVERVVCVLKNGNILVLYEDGTFLSHDLESGEATVLVLLKGPREFETFVHIASLNWIDTPIHTSAVSGRCLLRF